ncbi:hypothetical protein ACFRIB_39305 [Streptomyces mirabilis]|uniref:hypothetical protein n=1 Tax=Streptomyces mirabilis TaxID=68239 RepID=UPI00368AB891
MEWFTLVATLLGAAVGVAGTLFIERVRAREAERRARGTARAEAYVNFLVAVHTASGNMRSLALEIATVPEGERHPRARAAFRQGGLYEARERVVLFSPEPIAHAADALFNSLRSLRDVVADGGSVDDPAYVAKVESYAEALIQARTLMRVDVGELPLRREMTW